MCKLVSGMDSEGVRERNLPIRDVRGRPLFTIYSPDLVSTEQEYLLARQNQKCLHARHARSSAKEGDWLLQAAADRLRQFGVPHREITNSGAKRQSAA